MRFLQQGAIALCLVTAVLLAQPGYDQQQDAAPSRDADQMFAEAASKVCDDYVRRFNIHRQQPCGTVTLRQNPTIARGYTIAVGPRQSKVVYSERFFAATASKYGDDAAFSILAHELGHHMDSVFGPMPGASSSGELRADAWSGCAVRLTGRDLGDVE